jgi:hypothetical protein
VANLNFEHIVFQYIFIVLRNREIKTKGVWDALNFLPTPCAEFTNSYVSEPALSRKAQKIPAKFMPPMTVA